jgi:hypothetical protein
MIPAAMDDPHGMRGHPHWQPRRGLPGVSVIIAGPSPVASPGSASKAQHVYHSTMAANFTQPVKKKSAVPTGKRIRP